MARGNETIVTANPRGVFKEGFINAGETPKPGTVYQIDPTQALQGGCHVFKAYNRGADGKRPLGAIWILTNLLQALIGGTQTTALAAGDKAQFYAPIAGEEFNMLLSDVAGTGDDHAAGEVLIINDTDGKLVATTGSPQQESFVLLETVTDPVADTLAWVQYSGY